MSNESAVVKNASFLFRSLYLPYEVPHLFYISKSTRLRGFPVWLCARLLYKINEASFGWVVHGNRRTLIDAKFTEFGSRLFGIVIAQKLCVPDEERCVRLMSAPQSWFRHVSSQLSMWNRSSSSSSRAKCFYCQRQMRHATLQMSSAFKERSQAK